MVYLLWVHAAAFGVYYKNETAGNTYFLYGDGRGAYVKAGDMRRTLMATVDCVVSKHMAPLCHFVFRIRPSSVSQRILV